MKENTLSEESDQDGVPRHRVVNCYFPLSCSGVSSHQDEREFLMLYVNAKSWQTRKESENIDIDAKEMAKREGNLIKTEYGKHFNQIAESIREKIEEDPSKYNDAWFAEHEEMLKNAGIYELTQLEVESSIKTKEFARKLNVIEARKEAFSAVGILLSGLCEGREDAAEGLFELGLLVNGLLERFYKSNPELFRPTTRSYAQIPVLAKLDPNWVDVANRNLEHLQVGKSIINGRFKSLAYDDEYFICRAWAREVVKCIDVNRYAPSMIVDICEYLQDCETEVSILPGKMPSWLSLAVKLPPFSKGTAKQWASLSRTVIREEIPNFHERPDFNRLVSNIKGRFRDAPGKTVKRIGTIQNAILDKIAETIESIAAN